MVRSLLKLVGEGEAISVTLLICEAKINEGISDADSIVVAGWLRSIRSKADGGMSPVGQKGRDKRGKRGIGPKRPNG